MDITRTFIRAAGPFTELRIDVELPPWGVEADLRRLHGRMRQPGDALHGLPVVGWPQAGFALRHRVADGEHYLYVQDLARDRLAGLVVLNRLVELGRRADAHLRAPHAKFSRAYQRRGLASAVYRWALGQGMCLISGARQSTGAHGLWLTLAREHLLGHVELKDRQLTWLGTRVPGAVLEDFHTRMVLLGAGWTPQRLASEADMRIDEDGEGRRRLQAATRRSSLG